MLFLNKKSFEESIYSPCFGECISLSRVADEVFSEKMMGEGVAFILESNTIYAPCDGKIMMIAPTKHAFGIKSEYGTEILVHIGLETSELNGENFNILVNLGDNVKAHTPIINIDMGAARKKEVDMTTPLIVTNVDISKVYVTSEKKVDLNTVVCRIKKSRGWRR